MSRRDISALVCGIALVGLWLAKHQRDSEAHVARPRELASLTKVSETAVKPVTATSLEAPAAPATAMTAPKAPEPPLPYATELAQYELLHRKVFLTEGEESEKDRLLKDSSILRSMGQRLLRSPATREAAEEQNSAITLLMEALRSGDRGVAAQVLGTVVTDRQIENEKMDRGTRENLAGVKADVLYQWRALQPEHEADLVKMLPGPVSQKIWQNVLSQQASNVAESVDAP